MEETPYGARRYLNLPNGVMNVVRSWLCSSRGHWWYPLRASNFVKILAFSSAMSATASAGVADWYLSCFTNLFRRERSTHIRILSVPFLGVTTMGAHHSVGTVTGAMTPCSCSRSNSAFSLSRYANDIARGAWMQNGWASSVRAMWNFSPSIVLMCPLKTDGNSLLMSGVDAGLLALVSERHGVMVGGGLG